MQSYRHYVSENSGSKARKEFRVTTDVYSPANIASLKSLANDSVNDRVSQRLRSWWQGFTIHELLCLSRN